MSRRRSAKGRRPSFHAQQTERERRAHFFKVRGITPGKDFGFGQVPLEVKEVTRKGIRRGVAVGL